ncbi:acyltransferase domain-containing protein [Methylocella sp.]|uniref:acyltransferase domain-containing protein n=1 Tax=Methylocella sp. TaxID=1978226 RepID=UPI0035B27D72
MTIAILCSGQGTQHRDMFALTADAPQAQPVFAAATKALGEDPRDFAREADEAAPHANRAGQILCVTQALAAFAALREALEAPGVDLAVAGYSIGELAACALAGMLAPQPALELAARRAALMDAAGGADGGLSFVRGLPRAKIDALCARFDANVAIVNPGLTFVVGGARVALPELCAAALAEGAAKAGALKVSVASHTPRLAAASEGFAQALAAQDMARPRAGVRLFSGIDAARVFTPAQAREKLSRQISQTIDWAGCLVACVEAGATRFLELGPGHALAAMAADLAGGASARALEDFRTLEGARDWLSAP